MEWLKENYQWVITTLIAFIALIIGGGGLINLKKKSPSRKGLFIFGVLLGIALLGVSAFGLFSSEPHENPSFVYHQGKVFYDNGEYRKAIKCFRQAAKGLEYTDIARTNAALFEGRSYHYLRKYSKAIDCYYESLAILNLDPKSKKTNYAIVYHSLGLTYEKQGLKEKALDQFLEAYRIGLNEWGSKDENTKSYLDSLRRVYKTLDFEESFDDWLVTQLAEVFAKVYNSLYFDDFEAESFEDWLAAQLAS